MATTTTHLSLEEFHRLYDGVKPNHEYWYGEAIPKPMATWLYGIFQLVLGMLLVRRGWHTAPEVTVKLSDDLELVPDVIASRKKPELPYPKEPVDLCVEILSPDDRLKNAPEKCTHYLRWGAKYVWIINPIERSAWLLTRESPRGIRIHPDGILTAGEDTQIPLTELFSEVDKLL